MQAATPAPDHPPRDSATIVLLRDAAQGMEVLLLRRNARASNMGGLYVFPGGKLDPQDHWAEGNPGLDRPGAALASALGEAETPPERAAALYRKAIEIGRHDDVSRATLSARLGDAALECTR